MNNGKTIIRNYNEDKFYTLDGKVTNWNDKIGYNGVSEFQLSTSVFHDLMYELLYKFPFTLESTYADVCNYFTVLNIK